MTKSDLLSKYFNLSIPTFRYVHKHLMNCGRLILDIGCSVGNYLDLLPKGSIGIDIDMNSLRLCVAKGFKVVCADTDYPLPFRDASVDGVLASHILEHVRSPIAFLEEVHRILKSDGVLVIGLPVEGGIASYKLQYFKGHRGARGHLYSFSLDNIDELLFLTGFKKPIFFFHIAKIGYKRKLMYLCDFLQRVLPSSVLFKLSSAYWAVTFKK